MRIAARRGDGVFFASVATVLSAIAGVQKVDVRPLTGSVVLQHTAPFARIGQAAVQGRLFILPEMGAPPREASAIRVDARMIAAAGLGFFALWQLAEGRILPPAITLAWYAAGLAGLPLSGESADGGE